jgi:probable phosphoglycerate mutase
LKTTVYLVRHGETEWNKEGKFQGCTDIHLSDNGMNQAGYLKEALKDQFDLIYTSPLKRAVHTAEIICEDEKNQKPIILTDIREIAFGEWEGLTIHQIREQYPKEYKVWRYDDENANLVGGDLSIKNASIRAKNTILSLVREFPGKRIAIVAHGGIIKASLIGIFDWKMSMYHKFFLGNTSITKLTFGESLNPILVYLNNTSHLPKE